MSYQVCGSLNVQELSQSVTLVALLTPILPWRSPSFSHCHLSPQRKVFKSLVIFSVIGTCPCPVSLHWIFPVVQDHKGQFQHHTEWLKHSPCYSRCPPWHKIFSFSYPTIFHLRSVTPWINLQFWLTSKSPEWTQDRHLKHSWLSIMMHFSMATTQWYGRLFLLMNLGPQRVQIKHSHGYTSCCSLTSWSRSLLQQHMAHRYSLFMLPCRVRCGN